MARWSLPARIATILVAALQMALPAAASVVDGWLGAEGGSVAHVEATSGSTCTPSHGADCAVCRVVTTSAGEPDGCPEAVDGGATGSVGLAALPLPTAGSPGTQPPARAPPLGR